MKRVEINSERWVDLRNLPNEVWRVIEDTKENGTYLISNYGRLKRLAFSGGRYHYPEMILKIHRNRDGGYYKARVGGKMYYVHRLVAMAFIKPKNDCDTVDHKNNDKSDNRAKNLRWTTLKTNANNPVSIWDRKERTGHADCKRPSLPRTQVNLKKYIPIICVSLGIFIY